MTKLKDLYESKKFDDFKTTVMKEVDSINNTLKTIYGDSAEFDDKGFITNYKTSNVLYEYEVNELIYIIGIKNFGHLLTESYFHKFIPDFDFEEVKENNNQDKINVYIQLENGDIGKDTIQVNSEGKTYLTKVIEFNKEKKNIVEKTGLCILRDKTPEEIGNFNPDPKLGRVFSNSMSSIKNLIYDKLPCIVFKSTINNNLFYFPNKENREVAIICEKDLRLQKYEIDPLTKDFKIAGIKINLMTGQI